jgi:CubicO group peptidase (beta-lactamase class C family)
MESKTRLKRCLAALALAPVILAGETRGRLERQAMAYASEGRFQGTVAVARDGKVVYAGAFGMADEEWAVPNTPETKFRIGSITKQFTGMAILLLEQQGKLKVTDGICQYLDDCPARWKPITLHHLLTHTSGIVNFTSLPDYAELKKKRLKPEDGARIVKEKPLDFEPGTRMQYSNTGYILLGAAIEKASGTSYSEFMRRQVFEPLGMKDTGVDDQRVLLRRRAKGYTCASKCENADFIDMSVPHAAGAMYSTVLDLVRWDEAIRAGRILTPENHKRWITPFRNDYAYGWTVRQRDGLQEVGHGGGIDGFSTMIVRYPEKGVVAAAFTNHVPGDAGKLAADLARLEAGFDVPPPQFPKTVELSEALLKQYEGVYDFSPAFSMTVALEGGGLVTQATNQARIPIFARSETEFFPKVVDALIRFEKDAGGKVTSLVLLQGGREMRAKRRP